MATYAAFKHVELYNVGSGKRRVLKPPGGGSSDIFAGCDAATPRSIKNHMRSNIFAAPSPIKASSTGDGRRPQCDSHNRLFGDSERPYSAAKNRIKSNIPIGGDESDATLKHVNGNGHTNSSREHINGSENGKSCDYNDNYSHSTDNLNSSKYYGYDVNLCKPTNFLNPTYNSKINLCINDDYISIVNNGTNNNRNPSGFRHKKRESNFFSSDENMSHATPLINNAHGSKIYRKTLNSSLPTAGSSLSGETAKPSGENVAPSNHVVNKNRIPPGGFSSGLW